MMKDACMPQLLAMDVSIPVEKSQQSSSEMPIYYPKIIEDLYRFVISNTQSNGVSWCSPVLRNTRI